MNRLKTSLSAVLLLMGTSASLAAQNAQQNDSAERYRLELAENARREAEQRDWVAKIFEIKFADPGQLQRALGIFRAQISYTGGRLLAVRAPKEIMPAIEDAVKRLDVSSPRKDAELTVFILMASDQPETGTLPATLQPVVAELRKVLAYKGFQLIDTLIARGGEGRDISLTGALPALMSQRQDITAYNFGARLNVESGALRVTNMRFALNLPNPGGGFTNVSIGSDVEIQAGQQTVVGKATFVDKAFILVMTAKF